ncbi:MAG: hypothetical protein NTW09_05755 [Candidatus Omnitrophica bacterium]|nr:hypothetical protein [Candidatus Omnitrophota bacterium]
MEIAAKFANILGNPTEDQKVLIDAIKGLLQDMNKVEKEEAEAGTNPELKKASDNLIQMVANILLAQAIPDLLKEGDIHGIKGIFKELDTVKTRIMREYEAATTPYYDKIKKDIMKNVNVLQLNNVISNTLAEEELRNMPRSNIDIIIAKLKKLEKRSFEEDYILQQESKYRKDYLDPNKKKLEDDMKGILENVTKKLNRTLEDVAKK